MFTSIHSFPSMGVTIMCCPIQQLKAQGPFTGEAVGGIPLLVRHLLLHRVHLDEAVLSLQALHWPSHRHLLVVAAKGKSCAHFELCRFLERKGCQCDIPITIYIYIYIHIYIYIYIYIYCIYIYIIQLYRAPRVLETYHSPAGVFSLLHVALTHLKLTEISFFSSWNSSSHS